jgi:uncharacterized protein YbaP (TraB family)
MKLNSFLSCAVASVALAISASCAAQEASSDTMPAGAQPGPALWQVSDEDTNVYLFGTVHVLPKDVDWFDGRIERAFNASDELVTEIGLDDMAGMQQVITEKAMLQGDRTLRELMTDENRQQYEAALGQFGIPAQTLDRMEPWMAAMTLSILPLQASGYSPDSGVEMALNGRSSGKTKASLETIEEQIGLFDTLPMDAQLTYLDEVVEAIPETPETLKQMIAEWLEGDAARLAEMMNDEVDDPALYARLLTDRNANWAEWIDQRMASPGNVFVAVGAGHLAGEGSVQEMLEEREYEVKRVWE